MNTRITNLLPIILMLFLAALTLWLRITMEEPGTSGKGPHRHDPDAIIDNLTVTRLDDRGVAQYKLTANRMLHFGDDDTTELTAPQVVKLGDGPTVTVTAERGTVTRDGDEAFFHGNVLVVRAATAEREQLQRAHRLPPCARGKKHRAHRPGGDHHGRAVGAVGRRHGIRRERAPVCAFFPGEGPL